MNMVDFTTPKSWKKVVSDYWIQLLFLSASLMIIGGVVIKPFKNIVEPGVVLLIAVVSSWYVKRKVETRLHDTPVSIWVRVFEKLFVLVATIGIFIVLIAIETSARDLWSSFKGHLVNLVNSFPLI